MPRILSSLDDKTVFSTFLTS